MPTRSGPGLRHALGRLWYSGTWFVSKGPDLCERDPKRRERTDLHLQYPSSTWDLLVRLTRITDPFPPSSRVDDSRGSTRRPVPTDDDDSRRVRVVPLTPRPWDVRRISRVTYYTSQGVDDPASDSPSWDDSTEWNG